MNLVTLPNNEWKPRWYQLPFWQYMENGGKRACLVWPRRHGKDLTTINWTAVASQQRVGTYWMVYPYLNQGKRIAWSGIDGSGKKFLDAFPQELVASRSNKDMSLELKNGSVFQIMGADYPDRFVGSNPIGIVFSEWSLMDPTVWRLTAPILAENGGWAVFIYTPRGENHGYSTLLQSGWHELQKRGEIQGTVDKWFCSKLTSKDCRVLNKDDLRELRKELGDEDLFQQEQFTSFTAPLRGAYYDQQMKAMRHEKRITEVAWEPKLPVHTAWDLGMDDATSCIFYQKFGNEIRIIDYYENSGEGLTHYVKYLHTKPYMYVNNHMPWDIEVRELGSGVTRKETLRQLGMKVRTVRRISVEDGIEAVRNILPRVWVDKTKCHRWIEAMKTYRKDYDPQLDVYMNKPIHDWSSHGADATRTLAVGEGREKDRTNERDTRMKTDYRINAKASVRRGYQQSSIPTDFRQVGRFR